MKLKVRVTDSHRNLPEGYWEELSEFYTENVWNDESSGEEFASGADRIRDFYTEYELEYGVKWFEIAALFQGKIVGVMRILRNPSDRAGWYFCDVHTATGYRKKGVASFLYSEAIKLVEEFYAAEYIEASVSSKNAPSTALHKSLGFVDTGKASSFANFFFEEDERIFIRRLLLEYPVEDTETQRLVLLKYLKKYFKEKGVKPEKSYKALLDEMFNNREKFSLVFCGENVVGFSYSYKERTIEFIE